MDSLYKRRSMLACALLHTTLDVHRGALLYGARPIGTRRINRLGVAQRAIGYRVELKEGPARANSGLILTISSRRSRQNTTAM